MIGYCHRKFRLFVHLSRLTQEMAFFEKKPVNSTLTGLDVYQMSPEFNFVVQDPMERIKALKVCLK